jgi:low temperature requirement protein LtrA
MRGRDVGDAHRPASTLELLFDLAFVIAFSVAGSEFAHLIAEGHYAAGLQGFGFAMFAVVWAWINFTWFASAFDTDDWIYRITTMVQIVGVVIMSLGLPAVFHSFDAGGELDNRAMVVGYVIMRVPMVAQWLRASRQAPEHCSACKTYALTITLTQLGWVALLLLDFEASVMFVVGVPLILAELAGPYIAERRGQGTPWHPHHIAERYGLLAIIALGEVLLGTVTSLGAVIDHDGWNLDVALIAVGGVGLTFGMWWIYFLLPAGHILERRRDKSFVWGYGHIVLFAAITAVGAGLHVAALAIEEEAHISNTVVMWSIAIPVAIYFVSLGGLVGNLVGWKSHTTALTVVKMGVVFGSVALASAGVGLAICILVVALAPAITVIAEETGIGRVRERELAEALA